MPEEPLITLSDEDLFGNDAAEDEDEEVFARYALKRPELDTFTRSTSKIRIVRAYKGEGKSAMLRLTQAHIARAGANGPLVINRTASALMPDAGSEDFQAAVRAWKAALLRSVAAEIGARIGLAWSDDGMSLVEEAERQGFRERNIVSAILDRIRVSRVNVAGAAEVEVGINRLGASAPERIVQRWAEGREHIWLVVDDVDQDFQNTRENRVRVAAFFVACRELVTSIREVRVRAAVRPNVWTVLKLEHEALSHVEQYMVDLAWSEEESRRLLARRIRGYLEGRGRWDRVPLPLRRENNEAAERGLIELVFEPNMAWGRATRPPHLLLYTLSKHRPRWMVELAKVAASRASRRHGSKISKDDLIGDLLAFGRRRIQDTVAEFRAHCPEVEEVISAFARSPEELSTDELLQLIQNRVLTHLNPHIAGISGRARELEVAAFLFHIGFIYARRDLAGGSYEHWSYADRPSLLRSRADIDAGVRWEIHPVFRQALEIRDSSGTEAPQRRPRR